MSDKDQTELLRQLIENLDQFRETTVDTFKVLHRKQKAHAERLSKTEAVVGVQGILLWLIIGALILGLLGYIAFLLTR